MTSSVTAILARADNGAIGLEGGLPWRIPADLKRFRMLTGDRPMIMGRRTFESLPSLLPGRRHIVLTRDREWRADGAEIAHDVDEALDPGGMRQHQAEHFGPASAPSFSAAPVSAFVAEGSVVEVLWGTACPVSGSPSRR